MPKLKTVHLDTPWADLKSKLTGDAAKDAETIQTFGRQYSKTRETILNKLKLFGYSTGNVERYFGNYRGLR